MSELVKRIVGKQSEPARNESDPVVMRLGIDHFIVEICRHQESNDVELSDGTIVSKGDVIFELHLDGEYERIQYLRDTEGLLSVGRTLKTSFERGLTALADLIVSKPEVLDIVTAIKCCSFLCTEDMAERYGFQTQPLQTEEDYLGVIEPIIYYSWAKSMTQDELGQIIHKRLTNARVFWMSTDELVRRYAAAS